MFKSSNGFAWLFAAATYLVGTILVAALFSGMIPYKRKYVITVSLLLVILITFIMGYIFLELV